MISQDLCNELHEQLVAERQRLEHEIENLNDGIRGDTFQADEQDSYDQHPADQGTELFEREKNMTLQRTIEVSLQEVNDALEKFNAGTYGICENCGEPIPEKRLRAMPAATHCIKCQSELEQAQSVRR